MKRIIISLGIGTLLGVFMLGAAFATLSFLRPGWLRTTLAGLPANPGDITAPVFADEGGTPLPTDDPYEPTAPTPEPLPTIPGACGGPQSMTIALLGMDTRGNDYDYRARTDAISLVRIDFTQPSAAMLSIPRDLYVPLPNLEAAGIEQSRINTAYLYGEIYDVPGGGPAEFKQTVELNLGVRVDRYVLINFHAFTALVDALGGIDVDVPQAIYDADFPAEGDAGTIVFELPAGRQHMDGQTALRYARTRHQDDDYHRVQRQQLVLLAIRDRLMSPEVIPQIPGLIAAMQGAGRTDLSPAEIAALACIGPRIDRSAIRALAIDGTMILPWVTPEGGSVSIPNRDVIAPVVADFLAGNDGVAAEAGD